MTVRATRHFDATPERVHDAFLDPVSASQFLFATATGEIVRCDVDACVGGAFTIIDRRNGEEVVHTGTYLEIDRPRRIVFTLSVPHDSNDASTVTIDIAPRQLGCHVTLTHELNAVDTRRTQAEQGWTAMLDLAASIVVDEAPTCGVGLAQHASILAAAGTMFEGLAETLALHRQMLRGDQPAVRQEDAVYADLAERWDRIRTQIQAAAALMEAQRDLPIADHDESAWGDAHLRAFEKWVTGQSHLFALLRVAVPRDEKMLASMRDPAPGP